MQDESESMSPAAKAKSPNPVSEIAVQIRVQGHSIRPSVRPSVLPSIRPSIPLRFSTDRLSQISTQRTGNIGNTSHFFAYVRIGYATVTCTPPPRANRTVRNSYETVTSFWKTDLTFSCMIWGVHDSDSEECRLLGCYAARLL
jgi:hypothetical protein